MLRCLGHCGEESRGTAQYGSDHPLVEAVFGVGKAVWNTIVLSSLSGPAEPLNRPSFEPHRWGTKIALVTVSSELCHQKFKKMSYFFSSFLFSWAVLLFWSNMVCVAVCRLELNAADWNLNCDLAAANCESAAQLLVKPLSSSHLRFLFVSWFISVYHFVRLGCCYFISSEQPFVKLPYVLDIF